MALEISSFKGGESLFDSAKRVGNVFGIFGNDVTIEQKYGKLYFSETGRSTVAVSACCNSIRKVCCIPATAKSHLITINALDCCESDTTTITYSQKGWGFNQQPLGGEYSVKYNCECISNSGVTESQIGEDLKNKINTDVNAPFFAICQTSGDVTKLLLIDKSTDAPTTITGSNVGVVTQYNYCAGCNNDAGNLTHQTEFLKNACSEGKCYNWYLLQYNEVLPKQ